jgi:hypothetical protein
MPLLPLFFNHYTHRYRNSDIWRGFPRLMVFLFRLVYLDNRQGCRTSVVAAVGTSSNGALDEGVLYLQPYKIPSWCCRAPIIRKNSNNDNDGQQRASIIGVPFPAMEALGPFMGFCPTEPRIVENV